MNNLIADSAEMQHVAPAVVTYSIPEMS